MPDNGCDLPIRRVRAEALRARLLPPALPALEKARRPERDPPPRRTAESLQGRPLRAAGPLSRPLRFPLHALVEVRRPDRALRLATGGGLRDRGMRAKALRARIVRETLEPRPALRRSACAVQMPPVHAPRGRADFGSSKGRTDQPRASGLSRGPGAYDRTRQGHPMPAA